MTYDVVVIGGGPAGMIAAGRAGQLGQSVLLLEKNKELGMKLSITGKDRCNVTHFTEDKNELIEAYGKNGRFLYSSLAGFSNSDVVDFFESWGVKMKVERGNRVFPVSNKSSDVRQALLAFLARGKVVIRQRVIVESLKSNVESQQTKNDDTRLKIEEVILNDGEHVKAKKFIITTGGLSYPATGSTGDGYDWARELGHNIINPRPALSPIVVSEWFIPQLEGLSLKNIELSIYKDDKKVDSKFGEMLFTNRGISGPVVLDLSKKVGELLEANSNKPSETKANEARLIERSDSGVISPASSERITKKSKQNNQSNIVLKLDLKPALDFKKLDQRIQRDFQNGNNKQFKNILENLLPKKFISVMILKSKIDPEKQVNLITKKERKRLVKLMKGFSLRPDKLLGFGKAIITTGGIDLKEVDSKTMQSRLVSNLYFAGEILDLDGPTGGYNLQIAWSTGYAAGGV
jgi:predicted flavoprotein YhiN